MILVTGATGNVGNQVARILAHSGEYVRVLARNPDQSSFSSGVDVVRVASGARRVVFLSSALVSIDTMGTSLIAHDGAIYTVTGLAAVTATQQLALIGKSARRALRYEEVNADVARQTLAFLPPPLLEGILASWERATCEEPFVSDDVARALRKPARSFEEWAGDNAAAFAKSAA
jgi:uncharacterized protein YbjT (DUF2867 family)